MSLEYGTSIKGFQKEKGSCTNPPFRGLRMEIGTLTSVLLGYSDPYVLYKYGKIQGDVDQLTLLQKFILPSRASILFDFF